MRLMISAIAFSFFGGAFAFEENPRAHSLGSAERAKQDWRIHRALADAQRSDFASLSMLCARAVAGEGLDAAALKASGFKQKRRVLGKPFWERIVQPGRFAFYEVAYRISSNPGRTCRIEKSANVLVEDFDKAIFASLRVEGWSRAKLGDGAPIFVKGSAMFSLEVQARRRGSRVALVEFQRL